MSQLDRAIAEVRESVTRLAERARADDKTPLRNSLALSEAAVRIGGPMQPNVVVFGDLNRFKRLNEHGHDVGDAGIAHIGQAIESLIVRGNLGEAYRPHGDEFVLLLHQHALEALHQVAAALAKCPFRFNGKSYTVSMSFGYALVSDGEADLALLLNRAEVACKVAKRKGDGHCLKWTPELQQSEDESVGRRFSCDACGTSIEAHIPKTRLGGAFLCPCCQGPLL